MSAFVLEDGVVYHTYSTYARGLDGLWGMYSGSTAPPGRNETGTGGAATTSTTRGSAARRLHADCGAPFFWTDETAPPWVPPTGYVSRPRQPSRSWRC